MHNWGSFENMRTNRIVQQYKLDHDYKVQTSMSPKSGLSSDLESMYKGLEKSMVRKGVVSPEE